MLNLTSEFKTPENAVQAKERQMELRKHLNIKDEFGKINTIAGVDVGYDNSRGLAHASIAVMQFDGLKILEQVQEFTPVDFPYIPGLLAFREIPALLAALNKLSKMPDLIMVDGQGIAHPRRMGIAAHLGVLLDWPAIGVAKSRLVGSYDEPGPEKNATSPLLHNGELIGTVLRSKEKTKPLFVSPGHRVSMESALKITQECIIKYRLPEPTRMADKYSKVKKEVAQLSFAEI